MVILVTVPCTFGKAVYFCSCFIQSFIMLIRPSWLIALFRSSLFVLIFLLILSVTERKMMRSPTAITDLSIFPSFILKLYWNSNVIGLLCHLSYGISLSLRRLPLYLVIFFALQGGGLLRDYPSPTEGDLSWSGPRIFSPITPPMVETL